jgi:pimeloyl-ACP methyl ester carboxylesterase
MIDIFTEQLHDQGYAVNNKMFIDGFSAGAMFAQRYTLLHPQRVQAVAAGQCGGAITLPEQEYNNTLLQWPLGIGDFDSLTGYAFDERIYRQVPQYICIGDQDIHNSTLHEPGEVWPSQEDIDFLTQNFGGTDPQRLQNQVHYLQEKGYSKISFELLLGIEHEWRPPLASSLNFFEKHKK